MMSLGKYWLEKVSFKIEEDSKMKDGLLNFVIIDLDIFKIDI